MVLNIGRSQLRQQLAGSALPVFDVKFEHRLGDDVAGDQVGRGPAIAPAATPLASAHAPSREPARQL
jgi:hypothetical protein